MLGALCHISSSIARHSCCHDYLPASAATSLSCARAYHDSERGERRREGREGREGEGRELRKEGGRGKGEGGRWSSADFRIIFTSSAHIWWN